MFFRGGAYAAESVLLFTIAPLPSLNSGSGSRVVPDARDAEPGVWGGSGGGGGGVDG